MTTGKTLLLSALLVGAVTVIHSFKIESAADAMMYLTYFGYLKPVTSDDGTFMTEDEMKEGISKFQYMTNMTITGEIDNATLAMMNMPRCGCPDVVGRSLDARRRKRYALGSRWSRTDLTFRIDSVTSDIASRADVDRTLTEALQVWSTVSPLTFRRVYAPSVADIVINFVRRRHGDGAPFDGPGRILAHAFFPENGRAHFDEDENWTIESYSGTNLYQVAAHEFGHNLGLGHSNVDSALMAPVYRGYVPNFQLHADDVAGIQAHYGVGSGSPFVTMEPSPAICNGNVDAVTTTRDRSTYIFEGTKVWKFASRTSRIAEGFPKPISEVFPGIPDNVDAALYYSANGKTYIFKGSQYWAVDNEVVGSGYPRDIGSNWIGLPNNLDTAFVWSGNGRIYFAKGDQYYRFNGRVDSGYPRPLSVWNVPGTRLGAAVQWLNRRTYFFGPSSDSYYRYDDRNFRVDAGYPRSTATTWQGCDTNLEAAPGTSGDGGDSSGVGGLVPGLFALAATLSLGITLH